MLLPTVVLSFALSLQAVLSFAVGRGPPSPHPTPSYITCNWSSFRLYCMNRAFSLLGSEMVHDSCSTVENSTSCMLCMDVLSKINVDVITEFWPWPRYCEMTVDQNLFCEVKLPHLLTCVSGHSVFLSILTAIFQVNMGYPGFSEAKDV